MKNLSTVDQSTNHTDLEAVEKSLQETMPHNQDINTKEVIKSLGLVETKEALLALFNVEPYEKVLSSDSVTNRKVNEQRLEMYHDQYERSRQLYLATQEIRPTYLIQSLKPQFQEYQRFQMSVELDKRDKIDIEELKQLWAQLHIVDDIIIGLVQTMPAHKAVGWQVSAQSRNYLLMPTVGRLRYGDVIADQTSLCSYVLGHFGVMSYTYDRGYYIGHVLGYLFICYYFASLPMNYNMSALPKNLLGDFEYASLQTPYLVRLLQTLDGESKKRIYQLSLICAKLSIYATDKRIEKLLVTEANDFNKKQQGYDLKRWLAEGVMPLTDFDNKPNDDY